MTKIGIEDTLLEYYKVTGKNSLYKIEYVDKLPDDVYQIRTVNINGKSIQFYDKTDIENMSSIIFWTLEFIN
ncbi:hypothetical protein [Aquimarina latercula]|uniref:hypothetical protein n=1 Tax=Aquimarina latercula TaxID=987 RepID=UPI000402297C|nr:hypothetical protein [Aquimarina latercula]